MYWNPTRYCGINNHVPHSDYERCNVCGFDITSSGSVAEKLDFFIYVNDYTWYIKDNQSEWFNDKKLNMPSLQYNSKIYKPLSKAYSWLWCGDGSWLGYGYPNCMIIEPIPFSKVIDLVSTNIKLDLMFNLDAFGR